MRLRVGQKEDGDGDLFRLVPSAALREAATNQVENFRLLRLCLLVPMGAQIRVRGQE